MRALTPRQILVYTLVATVLIEALTLLFRFTYGMQSEIATASSIGWMTGGVRVHHGFVGLVLLLLAMLLRSRRAIVTSWLIVLGTGLLLSDLVHHFLVLYTLTGNPEFSLFYPEVVEPSEQALPSRRVLWWTTLIYVLEWLIRIGMLIVITMRPQLSSSVALTWLLLIFFWPWLGWVFYWLFGQTRLPPWRESRLARLPQALAPVIDRLRGHPQIRRPELTPELAPAAHLATNLGHLPILGGNSVELLTDYDATIDRLVADIDGAQNHVHLLFYIFADDATALRVIAALERAAKRGVACRVLVDAFGSGAYLDELIPKLEAAGVRVFEVLPLGLFGPKAARLDLRNHRKIAVIDGRIGYTGSQNLVDARYKEDVTYEELMARVTGPVVLELQYVFVADWYLESEEVLDNVQCFPDPVLAGEVPAQVLPSGPGYPALQRLLVALMHGARRRVVITTPYFIPDEPLLQAMETAVLRGVEIHLIVSKKMDQLLVGFAQRSYYEELLESGIHVHVYHGNFLHAKHVTFDEDIALVGSTNFDIRSFRLNAEVAIVLYDRGVTGRLQQVQERYFRRCERISAELWRKRPYLKRLAHNLARLFSPLL